MFSFFTSSRRERSSGILKTGAWTRTKLNTRCDSNVPAERRASGGVMYNFKTFWIPTGEESGAEALHHRVKQGVLHPVSVHQLRGHRGTGWWCSFSLWQHSYCVYMEFFFFIQERVTSIWGFFDYMFRFVMFSLQTLRFHFSLFCFRNCAQIPTYQSTTKASNWNNTLLLNKDRKITQYVWLHQPERLKIENVLAGLLAVLEEAAVDIVARNMVLWCQIG